MPSWTVATILVGVISFFHGTETTVGSMNTTTEAKKRYALESVAFNAKDTTFRKLFGEDGRCTEAFAVADATIAAKKSKGASAAAAIGAPPAAAGGAGVFKSQDTCTHLEKVSGSEDTK